MLKAKEIRDQSIPELEAMREDLYKELFGLNNLRKGSREGQKTGQYRNKRRELARVLTILTEKKGV
jgi:large subunit ribosomal protein L29